MVRYDAPVRGRGTLKMPQSAAWHDGMMPQSAAWPLEPELYLVHNSRYAHAVGHPSPPPFTIQDIHPLSPFSG